MSPLVFIPTTLLKNPNLPSVVLATYLRLRLLSGDSLETPPQTFAELARSCDRTPPTLHTHLTILRAFAALSWSISSEHTWIITFPSASPPADEALPAAAAQPPPPPGEIQGFGNPKIEIPKIEIPNALSLYPESVNNYFDTEEERGEARVPNPSRPDAIYHEIANLRPNKSQRAILAAQVTDMDRWRGTLTHWMSHRWNPKNLPGMLELYHRGGPSACRYCDRSDHALSAAQSITLSALEELRGIYARGIPEPDLRYPGET